jgi:hypothetical protein
VKIHLVANWNDSWKWISMQTAAAVIVLNTFALSFPPSWSNYVHGASAVLGALSMYGRLIQQTAPDPGMPDRTIHVQAGETVAIKAPEAVQPNEVKTP